MLNQFLLSSVLVSPHAVTKALSQIWGPPFSRPPPRPGSTRGPSAGSGYEPEWEWVAVIFWKKLLPHTIMAMHCYEICTLIWIALIGMYESFDCILHGKSNLEIHLTKHLSILQMFSDVTQRRFWDSFFFFSFTNWFSREKIHGFATYSINN